MHSFWAAQGEGPNLHSVSTNAVTEEDGQVGPYFCINKGLVYPKIQKTGEVVNQLLVPLLFTE